MTAFILTLRYVVPLDVGRYHRRGSRSSGYLPIGHYYLREILTRRGGVQSLCKHLHLQHRSAHCFLQQSQNS